MVCEAFSSEELVASRCPAMMETKQKQVFWFLTTYGRKGGGETLPQALDPLYWDAQNILSNSWEEGPQWFNNSWIFRNWNTVQRDRLCKWGTSFTRRVPGTGRKPSSVIKRITEILSVSVSLIPKEKAGLKDICLSARCLAVKTVFSPHADWFSLICSTQMACVFTSGGIPSKPSGDRWEEPIIPWSLSVSGYNYVWKWDVFPFCMSALPSTLCLEMKWMLYLFMCHYRGVQLLKDTYHCHLVVKLCMCTFGGISDG